MLVRLKSEIMEKYIILLVIKYKENTGNTRQFPILSGDPYKTALYLEPVFIPISYPLPLSPCAFLLDFLLAPTLFFLSSYA